MYTTAVHFLIHFPSSLTPFPPIPISEPDSDSYHCKYYMIGIAGVIVSHKLFQSCNIYAITFYLLPKPGVVLSNIQQWFGLLIEFDPQKCIKNHKIICNWINPIQAAEANRCMTIVHFHPTSIASRAW